MEVWVDLIKTLIPALMVCVGAWITSYFVHIWPTKREEGNNKKLQYHEALKIRYSITTKYYFLHLNQIEKLLDKNDVSKKNISNVKKIIDDILLHVKNIEDQGFKIKIESVPFILVDLFPETIFKLKYSELLFDEFITHLSYFYNFLEDFNYYPIEDFNDDPMVKYHNSEDELEFINSKKNELAHLYNSALKANEEAKSMYLAYFEKKYPESKPLN